MMKRCICAMLMLMLLLTGVASASELTLTDAPGTPTQDVVTALEAHWLNEQGEAYDIQVMEADQLTMDTVTEIYTFVEEGNRPARYFPEEVQQAIVDMYSVDVDALYMTEFMRLHAAEAEPEADVQMVVQMDVDYQPGELVVVVLGDTSDPEALEWTVIEAETTALGEVTSIIPQETLAHMQGEDVLFSLLTVRKGQRGGVTTQTGSSDRIDMPSKTAYDLVNVGAVTGADGQPLDEDFRILVVDESDVVSRELGKIRQHVRGVTGEDGEVVTPGEPIVTYFPQVDQDEMQMLLGADVDLNAFVAYEYVPLITENYQDTYGDALAPFTFATPYEEGQMVVTMLGLPKADAQDEDDTLMDWAVQRAEVKADGTVEIVFDQLTLIGMGEETGLLVVISEPLED